MEWAVLKTTEYTFSSSNADNFRRLRREVQGEAGDFAETWQDVEPNKQKHVFARPIDLAPLIANSPATSVQSTFKYFEPEYERRTYEPGS